MVVFMFMCDQDFLLFCFIIVEIAGFSFIYLRLMSISTFIQRIKFVQIIHIYPKHFQLHV